MTEGQGPPEIVPIIKIEPVGHFVFPGCEIAIELTEEERHGEYYEQIRACGHAIFAPQFIYDQEKRSKTFPFGTLAKVVTEKRRTPNSRIKFEGLIRVRCELVRGKIEQGVAMGRWTQIIDEPVAPEIFQSPDLHAAFEHLKQVFGGLMARVTNKEIFKQKSVRRTMTAIENLGETVNQGALTSLLYDIMNMVPYMDFEGEKPMDLLRPSFIIFHQTDLFERLASITLLLDILADPPPMVGAETETRATGESTPKSPSYEDQYLNIKDHLPDEAREEIERELARLKQSGYPGETSAAKNHLDWLLRLFSLEDTQDSQNLEDASRTLEEDHYGLEKIKEQILEFLAVRKHVPSGSGDILCFVGPPGIGKTSLGKSIARALCRKFTRLSLGGITDVGEIRGHELIYIRTHPGHIIQNIVKSGSRNPVFVLDEIDKIGEHWRGDPAAALLAVLDPEQNREFLDTFISVPFDLSRILFICTANNIEGIPRPLRDRTEIISLPGYTPLEKLAIGKQHLVRKQREKQGFPLQRQGQQPLNILISDGALKRLIEEYTKEAGVRQIEREIRRIYRKIARRAEQGEFTSVNEIQITAQNLHIFAGKPRIYPEQHFDHMPIGCVPMFAVSDDGGHFFYVEVLMERGRNQRKIKVTGVRGSGESRERMNNLIEESFDVAFDSLMLEGGMLHEPPEERQKKGEFYIHVHIRDGATPKDGPSAGIPAIAAAFGLLTNTPIEPFVGATGEIDLKLGILEPIGGLKEKALAAHHAGIKRFVIPKDNERDLEEVPAEIKSDIAFIPCRSVWKALLEFFPNNERILRHIEGKTEWSS